MSDHTDEVVFSANEHDEMNERYDSNERDDSSEMNGCNGDDGYDEPRNQQRIRIPAGARVELTPPVATTVATTYERANVWISAQINKLRLRMREPLFVMLMFVAVCAATTMAKRFNIDLVALLSRFISLGMTFYTLVVLLKVMWGVYI